MDRVYVGNLPPDVRIKDIDDFFRPFGNLVYIDVNHRANPVYALVQFDSPRNAFMAVKSRHGYNYEGYTLQLKLAESEVRRRRDATPPPPPPMLSNYSMQSNRGVSGSNYDNFNNNRMGQNYGSSSGSSSFQSSQWGSFDNYNNSSRSNVQQYSSNNRMNMGQQNMDYSSNNRSNMLYSSSGRSNMSQQNMSRSNTNQSLNNRSNTSYSNDRSNMPQQNMMNYSSNNRSNMSYFSNDRSNMPQQNSMFSNTNQATMNFSSARQSNTNWGNNDFGVGNMASNDFIYNASNDPYANASFEDNYTRGLSGAGRKWFNRYIREGYSAEEARAKALERRTVPYMRNDPKVKPVVNDPTNAALENIGTTIMSLLSNTAVDDFNSGNQMMPSYSNWGSDNFDMPGSSRGRGEPRNAVSRRQYLKSLSILKELRGRRSKNAKDRLTKKYHTQIVSDYERYQKQSGNERDRKKVTSSSEGKSYTQLLVAFKKKKQHLLISARKMGSDKNTRSSGAFRKRMRILMTEGGFPEIEAKALAVHPISQLNVLMSMKADYEAALKRKQEKFTPIKRASNRKTTSYRDDIKYIKKYESYRVENLRSRTKSALRACLDRVHKHEREKKLPLTKSKFTRLLSTDGRRSNTRRRGRRSTRSSKTGTKKQDKEKDKTDETKENAADDEGHGADTVEEDQNKEGDENMGGEEHVENVDADAENGNQEE